LGFIDWIKNHQASKQQPLVASKLQDQKPETAKPAYARQAMQDKANEKPIEQIPQADKALARTVGERIDKATRQIQAPRPTPAAPHDSASNPEPMRQTMMNQEKAAPALTPTSAQAGMPAGDKEAPSPSKEAPARTPEKPARAPQAWRRPRPSWER
jgi:hypothetical protein